MSYYKRIFARIKRVLEFALTNPYSDFYRRKYKGINFKKINDMDQFFKLPYLTRQELIETDPYKRIFVPLNKINRIGITSGTTDQDKPLIILQAAIDQRLKKELLDKPNQLKVKTSLLLYSVLPGQHRLLREHFLEDNNIRAFLGDIRDLPLTAKIARALSIDAIQTSATALYYFIPHLKKEYDLNKIHFIALGGEYCSDEKYKFFKKNFKKAFFKFNFGSNETERRGYKCDFLLNLPLRFFHPFPNFFHEVLDQNLGDDSGELVLTHLITKTAFPFIRYNTGDRVRIKDYKCRCGQDKLMEVFGKLEHDLIKIHGAMLHGNDLRQALQPYLTYLASDDFQMHVFETGTEDTIKPKLKLQLVLKNTYQDRKNYLATHIAREISNLLYLSPQLTLSQLVEKGVFLPMVIEFVDTLPVLAKQKPIISHIK